VTTKLFEATKTTSQALTLNLQALLNKYVKDEVLNLGMMTITLKFVISRDNLKLQEPFLEAHVLGTPC
jgi:hypothetical protein